MANTDKKPIRIGAIIHLRNEFRDDKNGVADGGYLDVRGWVKDMSVISQFQDERIRKFVSTHESASRTVGSGSWLILSANEEPKANGEPLVEGDKIHLLNMNPGAGYLDTFEWVNLLDPFKDYPMQIGVFATSTPKRDGGLSGTWTIELAGDQRDDKKLVEGDTIHLISDYPHSRIPGPGYLHTYREVTQHNLFEKYDGQRLFVFTGPSQQEAVTGVIPPREGGSPRWTVTLSNLSKNLYHVKNRGDGENAQEHEGGLFKIGSSDRAIMSLNLTSDDQGEKLSGTVAYVEPQRDGSQPQELNFRATHRGENVYDVEILQSGKDPKWLADGQWLLGARKHQRIIAMKVALGADSDALTGAITYAGEKPIKFSAKRELKSADEISRLLGDVLHPEWIEERIDQMEMAIVANEKLLAEHKKKMSELVGNGTPGQNPKRFEPLDPDFQHKQLENLSTLTHLLNSFARYTLYELMKQSLNHHRNDRDDPVAPLHLFRKCFEHIATDHEITQQATLQREWHGELDGNFLRTQAVELLIFDKLAIKALAPFQRLVSDRPDAADDLVIISYLSERTHIHLMPYTKKFILLGVSYDRVPPAASIFDGDEFIGKNLYAFELLAIPHEMGHYVYRHGRLNGKTFSELSAKFESNPYYPWCEELFADVYGCIVAGPLAAISMQALLMSIDRERAWKDDAEHPTPVLRIFIFAEILRVLKDKNERYHCPNVINKLDGDWAEILKIWGYDYMDKRDQNYPKRPVRVYSHDKSSLHLDQVVNVTRVIKAIRPIIQEYVAHLLGVAFGVKAAAMTEPTSPPIPWTQTDKKETGPYNVEMHRIVNLNFAREKVERQAPSRAQADKALSELSNPDERLQQYLRDWDDKGPHGSGAGAH